MINDKRPIQEMREPRKCGFDNPGKFTRFPRYSLIISLGDNYVEIWVPNESESEDAIKKKYDLFYEQKKTLDGFLDRGAIDRKQYQKSLRTMAEKMGFSHAS